MSQTVFKYPLGFSAANRFDVPAGAEIVMTAMQNGQVTLWAVIDADFPETVKREFIVAGTGHPVEQPNAKHVGSCVDGMYVWHVFELT